MEPLLHRKRHIAEDMCRIVASRRERNVDLIERRAQGSASDAGGGWASELLGRVMSFFRL